jgi:uncharacterized repeat protein (TIGR01451 family)
MVSAREVVSRLPLRVWLVCSLLILLAGVSAPRASAQAVGTFETRASSPVPVTSVTIDPTTNIIYAQENQGTGFYSYNPSTNAWTTLATAPIDSGNNGGAAYVGGKIYTVYTNNNTQMGIYDIASNSWTTIGNPLALGTGNITATGGLLYLAEANTFVSYNPATDVTTPLANPPNFTNAVLGTCNTTGFKRWGGLQPFGGKIYGHQGDGCDGFAVYDIASNTWTELPNVPGGAVLGSAIDPVSGTYFAYGDYDGSNFYRYSIASNSWSTITFPFATLDDGGMAYVSLPGQEGIYATYGEGNPGFTRYVTAVPTADLSVTKTASSSHVTVGNQLTYTIHVHNGGPNDAPTTTVIDTLPSHVSFVSASTTQGSCTHTTTVTCNLGTLKNGATATVTIKVKGKSAGTATNTVTVSTPLTDSNAANNKASATVTVVAPQLRLSVSPRNATAGQSVCYSFRATSSGHGVRGATVHFAGHSARTSSSGRARICVSLRRGTYHARVTKSGFRSARAAVSVRGAPTPVFTG